VRREGNITWYYPVMSLCGCLCGAGGDSYVCSLCLERVSGELWTSGEHRSQCASRNTAKLSTFPAHPSIVCTMCRGKVRVWPDQGPKFVCSSPPGTCSQGDMVRQNTNHHNRFACYLCDYNLCKQCVQRMDLERERQKENSRQLVSCLKSMCDRVKEKVAEETKQKKQTSFDSNNSTLLGTEDFPLIDEVTPVEERGFSHLWRSPCLEDSTKPTRGSVVTYIPQSPPTISSSLPSKPLACLSPDVFHLRAPLVPWENFLTPAGSVETVFESPTGTVLEGRE